MEFKIGEETYRTGKLSAMRQFHVGRKIAPVLLAMFQARAQASTTLDGVAVDTSSGPTPAITAKLEAALLGVARPVADVLSQMSEKDCEYIIGICLEACERKQGEAWAKVVASNGKLMFEDMGLRELMKLSITVIQENLGSFFAGPLEALQS